VLKTAVDQLDFVIYERFIRGEFLRLDSSLQFAGDNLERVLCDV
jgi:hypothetical protein